MPAIRTNVYKIGQESEGYRLHHHDVPVHDIDGLSVAQRCCCEGGSAAMILIVATTPYVGDRTNTIEG